MRPLDIIDNSFQAANIELGKELKRYPYKTKGNTMWGIKSTTESKRNKACKALKDEYTHLISKKLQASFNHIKTFLALPQSQLVLN